MYILGHQVNTILAIFQFLSAKLLKKRFRGAVFVEFFCAYRERFSSDRRESASNGPSGRGYELLGDARSKHDSALLLAAHLGDLFGKIIKTGQQTFRQNRIRHRNVFYETRSRGAGKKENASRYLAFINFSLYKKYNYCVLLSLQHCHGQVMHDMK